MRKAIVLGLIVLCLAGLVGCSKKPLSEASGENTGFVSEDFYQGNTSKFMQEPMLMTDKGYYYYSEFYGGLRYYDIATGKEMYLCNKPECKHDGNAFCVATNDKYTVIDYCLYNGRILTYVLEETDTQQLFKVLSIASDGSALSEVATVMELEKTAETNPVLNGSFYVHRNKALLLMQAKANEELGDVNLYGTAILDLETREVTYLDAEPMGTNNPELTDVKAHGDYFYFCKKEGQKGKKKVVHRYHITDGTDESYSFLTGFVGDYVVVDDDTVAYLRKEKNVICVHHRETGENEEITFEAGMQYRYHPDGTLMTVPVTEENLTEEEIEELLARGERLETKDYPMVWYTNNCPETILMDESYIYIPMASWMVLSSLVPDLDEGVFGDFRWEKDAWVRVFDHEFNELAQINIFDAVEAVRPEGIDWEMEYAMMSLRYMGEDIYLEMCPKGNTSEWYVFHCKRADFLAGKPEFEFVFRMNRNLNGEILPLDQR